MRVACFLHPKNIKILSRNAEGDSSYRFRNIFLGNRRPGRTRKVIEKSSFFSNTLEENKELILH